MADRGALIVTGASRGIGAAVARLAATRGFSVCVNYANDAGRADEVVAAIKAQGGRAIACKADVSDAGQVRSLFQRVDRDLGPLSGLVNNAGVNGGIGPLMEMSESTIATVIATNLTGTIHCCREAISRLSTARGGKGGTIVNVSSQAGRFGGNMISVYAATKAAIDAFTMGLAREVGRDGIRINAVSPGIIATDLHDAMPEDRRRQVESTIPVGRAGSADEVAETILWMLTEAPGFVTGSVVPIAGGR